MFSLYAWLFPATASLELDAYPHIVDAVLSSADLSTLLALRQTCRGMKQLVDARFAHIIAGPDGSLRAIPRPSSPLPASTPSTRPAPADGIDIAPLVDAYCRSAASGPSWNPFRAPRTTKPFIFGAARQIDRYHCPGADSSATPCSGEGEDGCACACAPVRGLVHFDRLEAVREWRCPAPELDEEAGGSGSRTPLGAWSLDKHLSGMYALRPAVAA